MNRRHHLRRAVAALVGVTVLVLLLSGCANRNSGGSKYFNFTRPTAIGALIPVSKRLPAHPFSGSLVLGGSTSLARYKGRPVVVNFFGSWCPPCRLETPQLALLADHDKDVQFLGVDIADEISSVKTFLVQSNVHFPVIFDPPERIPLTLDVPTKVAPFTVLVDKSGSVAAVYLGPLTPTDLKSPLARLAQQN